MEAAEQAALAADKALARSPASGGPDETPAARELLDRIRAARAAAREAADADQRRLDKEKVEKEAQDKQLQAQADAEALIAKGYAALKQGGTGAAVALAAQARQIIKDKLTPPGDKSKADELDGKAQRVAALYQAGGEALVKAKDQFIKWQLDDARKDCSKSIDDFDLAVEEGGKDNGQPARDLLAKIREEIDKKQALESLEADKRKAEAAVHELIQKGYFALRNGFPR